MKFEDAKIKIDSLKDPRIKEVGHLILGMGLELIACGDETKIEEDEQTIGHIDLLFKDDDVKRIFFIEVSVKQDKRGAKINYFLSRWENAKYIKIILKRFKLANTFKITRLYVDLSGKTSKPATTKIMFQRPNNYYLNEDDFNYFCDAYDKVGVCSRNDLYSYLDIKPADKISKDKDAIQFFLGDDIRAYSFVDTAKNLLRYCYVFRRKKGDSGYQRILYKKRINEIAKKIKSGKLYAFPNSILISCPDEPEICHNPMDKSDCPTHVKIKIPNYFSACRIIDGQHRILSFAKLDNVQQETHFIPVVIFENIRQHEEMRTFIEINSGQKPIDNNLILLLQADFKWDKKVNAKEYFEKQAVIVVKKLSTEPPLKDKIYIPQALEKKKGRITLTTLVTAIIGNNLIGEKVHLYQKKHNDINTPYKKIKKIFVNLMQKMPKYCQNSNSFFLTNRGLRLLFRLMQLQERNRKKKNINVSVEEFIAHISSIFSDKLIEKLDDFYGEGGANRSAQEVFKILQKKYKKKYTKIVLDLRQL